jgi:hypothetical protein
MGVLVDLYCASYPKPPDAVTLDTHKHPKVRDRLVWHSRLGDIATRPTHRKRHES